MQPCSADILYVSYGEMREQSNSVLVELIRLTTYGHIYIYYRERERRINLPLFIYLYIYIHI